MQLLDSINTYSEKLTYNNNYAGCTFVVAPNRSHMPQRILVNINETSFKPVLMTVGYSPMHIVAAAVTFRDPDKQDSINTISECRISNLAVYRGKNHITDIHHEGFNITNGGIIQVNSECKLSINLIFIYF